MADGDSSGDVSSFLRAGSDAPGTYAGSGGQFDIVGGNLVFIGASGGRGAAAVGPTQQLQANPRASSVMPTSVPAANVARPAVTPIGSANGSPAAAGFDLWQSMMDNVLNAERLRQSAIDQQVNVARLIADLERASPTRAADLSVALGLPGLEPNLGFANAFTNEATSGVFGGRVGTQDIKLPFAFSGKELSFLGNNPNTAQILADIGDRFGRPDLLKTSASSAIPTSASLLGTF